MLWCARGLERQQDKDGGREGKIAPAAMISNSGILNPDDPEQE
jgi:hypothetical protein